MGLKKLLGLENPYDATDFVSEHENNREYTRNKPPLTSKQRKAREQAKRAKKARKQNR